MKRQEVFVDQDRMYALTRDSLGKLYLEVVCGGFAMENIVIPLNADEEKEYKDQGKSYLDNLSLKVCKDLAFYRDRSI